MRILNFDILGSVLITGAFVSGVMAISFGGVLYAWSSDTFLPNLLLRLQARCQQIDLKSSLAIAYIEFGSLFKSKRNCTYANIRNVGRIVGLFCYSGVVWTTFRLHQSLCYLTSPQDRLFPCEMVLSWEMSILFIQTASSIGALFVSLYFVPLYFQFVRNDHVLEAAVRLLPLIVVFIFATVSNGIVESKFGYYQPWYIFGSIAVLIGAIFMHLVSPTTSTSATYGFTVLIAIGPGSYNNVSFAVAQTKAKKEDFPLATALISMAQIGGLALNLAISNSDFINRAEINLTRVIPNAQRAQIQEVIAGAGGGALFNSLNSVAKAKALEATTDTRQTTRTIMRSHCLQTQPPLGKSKYIFVRH